MIFKDIVNRNIVSLKNCDEEPIHVPGSIQPHGFLIAVNQQNGLIAFCSENVSEFMGQRFEQLLGKEAKIIFDREFTTEIEKHFDESVVNHSFINRTISDKEYSITIHKSGGYVIVEGEPVSDNPESSSDLYSSSKQLLGYMEDSYTLKELCSVVANAIKSLTGYDRVMIYRFDSECNGEVFAESKEDHLEAFLGLHYPHTDIPAQARELYIKNQLRIIGDVTYTPVPIYTIENVGNEALDLGHSVLRSVSPIHIQYLHNMGVGATLTISLLHKGKLWGLIACHHYSPKYISQGARLAAKLHGHFITSQIDIRLLNEENEYISKTNLALEKVTGHQMEFSRESIALLMKDENLLKICNASGASLLFKNKIYRLGKTPFENDIRTLALKLSKLRKHFTFHTESIGKLDPGLAELLSDFPGICYFSFDQNHQDCLIWYRPETVSEKSWAGDPQKAIEKDQNGLSPRKSFMLWKETVKGTSLPWKEFELRACAAFYNFLSNHLRSIVIYESDLRQREITEELKQMNEELEDINWISTHDLQEPLPKIRIMSSSLLSDDTEILSDDATDKLQKINASAKRMQKLISDILGYAKIKTDDSSFETIDLNELLESIKREKKDVLSENEASMTILGELPAIQGIRFLLGQLFSHFVSDSLKFARKEVNTEIEISLCDEKTIDKDGREYYCICYKDNGIGFDEEYNESIFRIFTQLNNSQLYTGTGIGLALSKKIMEKHHGFIKADGEKGKGTSFYLYFPTT